MFRQLYLAAGCCALLLALTPPDAQAQVSPSRTIALGTAGGHRLEFLAYPTGAGRCQAVTVVRWRDGVLGRSGAEVHFDGEGGAGLTYFISKATWTMRDSARMAGTLTFSSGPAFHVTTEAVGATTLRISAPHESFQHWRGASRAIISLDSGFVATWDLAGTNAAGAVMLECVSAVLGRSEDPMARRGNRDDPMAPTPTVRGDARVNWSR